jgi:ubiquinone/menaquinone biosynthesis C-methylase UbiE
MLNDFLALLPLVSLFNLNKQEGLTMKKDQYRIIAKIYDWLYEPSASILRRIGLKVFTPRENISILDVGCGTGTQLALYHKAGCMLFGVDTSAAMLEKARRKLGDSATLYLGDAAHMTFPDKMFDLVTMVLVLHEMPALLRPAVLSECKRVVKTAGRVLLIDFNFGPYPFPMGYVWRVLRRFFEITSGRQHYANYLDFRARGGLEPLIADAHFSVDKKVTSEHKVAVVYLLQA